MIEIEFGFTLSEFFGFDMILNIEVGVELELEF